MISKRNTLILMLIATFIVDLLLYNAIKHYDGMDQAWIAFNVILFIFDTGAMIIIGFGIVDCS